MTQNQLHHQIIHSLMSIYIYSQKQHLWSCLNKFQVNHPGETLPESSNYYCLSNLWKRFCESREFQEIPEICKFCSLYEV